MGMGMDMPFQGLGGFMLPGAPGMLPPEMMAAMAMGGMPGGPIMPPRAAPRPPPGPPPGEMAGSRTPPDSPERGQLAYHCPKRAASHMSGAAMSLEMSSASKVRNALWVANGLWVAERII